MKHEFYTDYRFSKTIYGVNLFLFFKGLDDQHMSGLYGHRSNSSASSSPPAHGGTVGDTNGPNGGLVVPQPINAMKGGHGVHSHHGSHGQHGHHSHHHMSHTGSITTNGSAGRKYQCKMCPQVGKVRRIYYKCSVNIESSLFKTSYRVTIDFTNTL